MDFLKYKRLKKLALKVQTPGAFIGKIAQSAFWYGVPLWTRAHYEWFFNRIKGGAKFETLFQEGA